MGTDVKALSRLITNKLSSKHGPQLSLNFLRQNPLYFKRKHQTRDDRDEGWKSKRSDVSDIGITSNEPSFTPSTIEISSKSNGKLASDIGL